MLKQRKAKKAVEQTIELAQNERNCTKYLTAAQERFERAANKFISFEESAWENHLRADFNPRKKRPDHVQEYREKIEAVRERLFQQLGRAVTALSAACPEAADATRRALEEVKADMSKNVTQSRRLFEELNSAKKRLADAQAELKNQKANIAKLEKELKMKEE